MTPEFSIDVLEPHGVMSSVRFARRRWVKNYVTVRFALADAVMLGMLDEAASHLEDHRANPGDWYMRTDLPDYFEEEILIRHRWKLENDSHCVM